MGQVAQYDLLGLGAVAIDDFLYVNAYPSADQKVRVQERQRQCGGLTGTALVAAARIGARCGYAGVLGTEELSAEVVACFQREGIDLSPTVWHPDARPAHSTIVVDRVHHTRTVFASLDGLLGADPERPEADLLQSTRVLLIDHHGLPGTLRAVKLVHQAGIPVVADLERRSEPLLDVLLPQVDHLVLSERFAQELTGISEPQAAAEQLWSPQRKAVVVTAGARGCWYCHGAGEPALHYPAFAVAVYDTTGCGDVFHGVYAAMLAEGRDLPTCVAWASAAAALKAQTHGGQAGIPDRQGIEQFLAERSPHK